MLTYSCDTTPESIINEALERECPDGYTIEVHQGSDVCTALTTAVNQGIDSHLEAVTGLVEFAGRHGKRRFRFDSASMLVMLRRLSESSMDASASLRSAILTTLNIEEI